MYGHCTYTSNNPGKAREFSRLLKDHTGCILPGLDQTTPTTQIIAQLDGDEKDKISHRGKATRQLMKFLE